MGPTVLPDAMNVSWLPTLQPLAQLYAVPRGQARFKRYLAWMQGGTDDVVLPVAHVNPMAGPSVAKAVGAWLDSGADDHATGVAAAAAAELPTGDWRAGFCVCDESGGWTDRATTDAAIRFEDKGALRRRLLAVPLWAGEQASRQLATWRVRGALYRAAHQQVHGLPRRLDDRILQEARAAAFAGAPERGQARDAEVVRAHLDADDAATNLAVLYGDGAARRLGYPPRGASPFGGLLAARVVYPYTRDQAVAALGAARAA